MQIVTIVSSDWLWKIPIHKIVVSTFLTELHLK
jgi:hypothetical protein